MGDSKQIGTNTCHHNKEIEPYIKSFVVILRLSKVSL